MWFRNIFIVWFLTGFWHGASWNFIVWGLYFGIILLLEKVFLKKVLEKTPTLFSHIYVLMIVLISFVIFNIDTIPEILTYLRGMFGLLEVPVWNRESVYYLKSYGLTIIMAVIGATPLTRNITRKYNTNKNYFLEPVVLALLLLITTGYLVDSSFNPFLYFRF